ncbi:MAG: amino acid ABC transporter permease [Treponema sp.]|jgi:His/Glu/Gln/Arg/opine family amino acid ABC transporter permease subunit|nr:amino acid ABC transporter permease [Treponema sp.]
MFLQDIPLLLQVTRLLQAFLINLSILPPVLLISMIAGFFFSTIRFYKIPVVSQFLFFASEIIRGSPFLLLIYAAFFILPLAGISLSPFGTGVCVLSVTGAVLMSEVLLSGLKTISKGQHYAADALGMSFLQKMRYIIAPQMIKLTLPSIVGQIVMTIKDTSIVSLVGLAEVVRTAKQISQLTLNTFLGYTIVGIFFFIVCYPLILLSKRLEKRLSTSS